MRTFNLTFLLLFTLTNVFGQLSDQNIITTDIDNFWTAYDKVITTKDSSVQIHKRAVH